MKRLFAVCAMLCLPLAAIAAENYTMLFKTQGSFKDVRDSVAMAIEGKGLLITHSNHIADMLERTGKDLGTSKRVYDFGEQMEFCSATVSRVMMEADPHAIVMCPYSVSVYKLPNDANIYVAFRKTPTSKNPALKKALADVEKLLTEIVKDAL